MKYFYDSYAVIEYFKGNEKYKKYFEEAVGILTNMNLIEIHYQLLTEFSEKDADDAVKEFQSFLITPEINDLIEASKFRKKHRKRNLSYTDCVGYTIAKKEKIMFLTGDKEFEGMENTEFIK